MPLFQRGLARSPIKNVTFLHSYCSFPCSHSTIALHHLLTSYKISSIASKFMISFSLSLYRSQAPQGMASLTSSLVNVFQNTWNSDWHIIGVQKMFNFLNNNTLVGTLKWTLPLQNGLTVIPLCAFLGVHIVCNSVSRNTSCLGLNWSRERDGLEF